MRKNAFTTALISITMMLLSLCGCVRQGPAATREINLGWMTSWATTAQIIQALSHTNIPQLCGVPLGFRSFLFGPDINEAALHGEVDCVNSGLVPTISLLATSDDWVVVARLIDSPLSTVARKGTGIKTFKDLAGRSLAVPFGGGTHPYVIQRIKENGLKAGESRTDVHLINLKPSEQPLALEQGKVDAVGTWEPQTAIVLERKLGDVIDTQRHIGVITVRKSLAEKRPDDVVKLLQAYIQANFYVAAHRQETDRWFGEASHMDSAVLPHIQVIEPNVNAKRIEEINLDLTEKDMALGQKFADTMFDAGLIARRVDFAARTDLSFLHTALQGIHASNPEKLATEVSVQK